MVENLSNTSNINSHYSSATNAVRPKNLVVSGPKALPGKHLYNDIDAKNRIKQANNEIELKSKEYRQSSAKRFWTVFGCVVAGVLGIVGIKKIINFFKKS